MAGPATHMVAYKPDAIDTLKTLEGACATDEVNLVSKISKLQLATDDGVKVTAVTYEETDDMNFGRLSMVAYQTDVDEQSQTAIHKSQGETFLLKGNAYVNNQAVKVLVFRKKP